MELEDLEIYRLAREIGRDIWKIYDRLNWQDKKIMGNQCVTSTDSMGANIAEGFGRYHYLDKNKFNYNARGSLLETVHWLEVLYERNRVTETELKDIKSKLQKLHVKTNNYISSTRRQKSGNQLP